MDSQKNVKIALVQMSMGESSENNLRRAIEFIGAATKRGAQIIAFPELMVDPYFPQEECADVQKRAQRIPGPAIEQLRSAARSNRAVLVCGSFYEKDNGKGYNTSVVIDTDGTICGKYRKMHIPYDPAFYEQNYFKEGDLGFPVFCTRYGQIGVLICYDQWFPEAARIMALRGADIIFYPTAIGFVDGIEPAEGDWVDAWQTVQRGHAIANGVHVAAVNRVGREGNMTFFGSSFVSGPFGTVLASGSRDKEEIVFAECDLTMNTDVREGWRFFYNRRPSEYKDICRTQIKKELKMKKLK